MAMSTDAAHDLRPSKSIPGQQEGTVLLSRRPIYQVSLATLFPAGKTGLLISMPIHTTKDEHIRRVTTQWEQSELVTHSSTDNCNRGSTEQRSQDRRKHHKISLT